MTMPPDLGDKLIPIPWPEGARWQHHPASFGVAWKGETETEFQVFAFEGTPHLYFAMRRQGLREWTITQVVGEFGPIRSIDDFKEAFEIFWGRRPETPVGKALEGTDG